MQGVDLVAAFELLVKQLRDEGELGDNLVAKRTSGDVIEVTAQVPHDPAGVTFQFLQCLAQAVELFGMGMAADLASPNGAPGGRRTDATPSRPLAPGRQAAPVPFRKAWRLWDGRWPFP